MAISCWCQSSLLVWCGPGWEHTRLIFVLHSLQGRDYNKAGHLRVLGWAGLQQPTQKPRVSTAQISGDEPWERGTGPKAQRSVLHPFPSGVLCVCTQ